MCVCVCVCAGSQSHLIFAEQVSMSNLVEQGVGNLTCSSRHAHLQRGSLHTAGETDIIKGGHRTLKHVRIYTRARLYRSGLLLRH